MLYLHRNSRVFLLSCASTIAAAEALFFLVVQHIRYLPLLVRIQMAVGIQGHFNVSVAQAFFDNQGLYSLMNQISHVAVTEIVYADFLYSAFLTLPFQLVLYRLRHNGKYPLVVRYSIEFIHIIFQLLC